MSLQSWDEHASNHERFARLLAGDTPPSNLIVRCLVVLLLVCLSAR